jgi:hypothetical protein
MMRLDGLRIEAGAWLFPGVRSPRPHDDDCAPMLGRVAEVPVGGGDL